jgi:hypothetical protein
VVEPAADVIGNLRPLFRRVDPALYVVWAAVQTLASARMFYRYMLEQTGGEWSAPLDDVFIHFDYARATALGHPFEWTIGNGYSSGNTSLTYPFVLAAGYVAGFTGRELMIWAAIVAAASVFGVLLAARPVLVEGPKDDWGRLSSYLLPPIFLGVGALDWSLWSGMEVSFFLATWAIALLAWRRLEDGANGLVDARRVRRSAWLLGAAGALLVTPRPEAAFTIAIFGLFAAAAHRRAGDRLALGVLVRAGLPAVTALVLQALANKAFTGEFSANGAIVKLALNNPYMTAADKWADYFGNVQYASLRNLDYHFADIAGEHMADVVPASWPASNPIQYLARTAWWAGVVPLALALLPLAFRRTRRIALVVWLQIVSWVVLVSLNGQVRWQNERYVMPAVAWMLIMTTLGVSISLRTRREAGGKGPALRPGVAATIVLGAIVVQVIGVLTRPPGPPHFRLSWLLALAGGALMALLLRAWVARAALVVLSLAFAYDHQIPKMRDQKWFFGRASRNIRDQHIAIGKYLAERQPKRVLVGDAGAILYESDRPGLDIIGLGGYHELPFARAGVHGMAATIELLERMPAGDRPDVLAIFPTWWGVLPLWFTQGSVRRFPVEGNVICGGYEQNVYKADWHLLGTGDRLRALPAGTKVKVDVDVADLVSEKLNGYAFDRPANGWTEMRILPDPSDETADMLDGGRRIAVGRGEHFDGRGLTPSQDAFLVVRSAPESAAKVRVSIDGVAVGTLDLERTGGWVERAMRIPAAQVGSGIRVDLVNEGPGDFIDFHAWLTQ